MRVIIASALAVVLAGAAAAQDTVKLLRGKLHRGVILEETGKSIRMVTAAGEIVEIAVADTKFVRRGKPVAKKVAERLAGVDRTDPQALFVVAEWAAGIRSLKKDSRRVALLALAADPHHAESRALLGHVHALGVWYPTASEARKAVTAEMKARGFKKYKDGWADPAVIADVKATPGEWIVDDFQWRLVSEVMRDRGMTEWNGIWYREAEKHVIDACRTLEERIDIKAHGARIGANVVVCYQGRQVAEKNAMRLDQVRRWFVKAFKAEHTDLDEGPESWHYILESRGDLGAFGRKYETELGLSKERVDFYMKTGSIPYGRLDHAVDTARTQWKEALVSQLGGRLLERFYWNGGFEMPDWMFIASAHHAEIAVFGEAVIWYIAPDEYGRREEVRTDKGRSVATVKTALKDMAKRGRLPTLEQLFRARTNTMTADLDTMGIGYLAFLLENHLDAWLGFITGMSSQAGEKCETRFRRYFGKGYAQIHEEFRGWLGAR